MWIMQTWYSDVTQAFTLSMLFNQVVIFLQNHASYSNLLIKKIQVL